MPQASDPWFRIPFFQFCIMAAIRLLTVGLFLTFIFRKLCVPLKKRICVHELSESDNNGVMERTPYIEYYRTGELIVILWIPNESDLMVLVVGLR